MTSDRLMPGEVHDIAVHLPGSSDAKTASIMKTDHVEVVRLVVMAGKSIPKHTAPGELIVHCLAGRVEFQTMGRVHQLTPGQLLYLPDREPHAVRGVEDSALLLTIVSTDRQTPSDVQEASEESFPASDSPAWTGVTGS